MNPKFPAVKTRSYADIEREATSARKALGFDPVEPLPSMLLFERLSRLRTGPGGVIPVTYYVSHLAAGVEAETRFSEDEYEIQVHLSPSTYEGLERDVPRDRFSTAHEGGHVCQHPEEVVRLSQIPTTTAALMRGRYQDLRPFEDAEWQANAFAAALLMPARALRALQMAGKDLTVELLCRRFVVSPPCAERRIKVFEQRKRSLLS